jgi:predicted Zn finger-like uncharacterized protein
MNVTCPNCATIYRVDPAKVPAGGVRARCNVCSAVFAVKREGEADKAPPAARLEPVRAEPARPEPPRAAMPTGIPPQPPSPAGAPGPGTPPHPVAPQKPVVTAPAGARPMPPAPAAPPARPAPNAPAAAPTHAAAPARPSAPPAQPATPAGGSRPAAPPPVATSPPRAAPPPPSGGRPQNPFLSQDPALKARRLARALISDMVVYHPGKRQEGLRDGNLKELFEEEIKKSWEEYAEQVGRDVADSTGYFREALNEILAGGRQIF